MKKWMIVVFFLASILLCFVIVPLAINFLFATEAPVEIMQAKWTASDALGYVAGALTLIGTMFLGLVSWSQNNSLIRREDETYIAENSCVVMLDRVELLDKIDVLGGVNEFSCALVKPTDVKDIKQPQKYNVLSMIVTLKYKRQIPALIRVIHAMIIVSNDVFEFEKVDDFFTRMAMGEDETQFELILITPKDRVDKIMTALSNNQMTIQLKLEAVTDKWVSTVMQCRAKLLRDIHFYPKKVYTTTRDSMANHWIGNKRISIEEIKYRNESKE